jgi:hypothetical protein
MASSDSISCIDLRELRAQGAGLKWNNNMVIAEIVM